MARIDEFHRPPAFSKWPILLLRLYTGVFFAWHGFGKLSRGNFSEGMVRFLESQESTFEFYRPFLDSVVLPNAGFFAALVTAGELVVGIAMLLGLATRYAAIAGALMVANFWFAKGQGVLAGQNHDVIWLVIFVVLAGLHAGRYAGLDERLSRRLPLFR